MLRRLKDLLPLIVLAGCRSGDPPGTASAGPSPVVRERTVVVFWLPASDTLADADGADLLDDFRYYTAAAAPALEDRGIKLVATNSDTIVVEAEGLPRRVIMVTGLDYPFGYVLVEPGYAEEIFTGVMTDEELVDEADSYFGDDADDESGTQRTLMRGRSGSAQDLANLRYQPGGREGFLQERRVRQQVSVLHDRVVGVARHVQHLETRAVFHDP